MNKITVITSLKIDNDLKANIVKMFEKKYTQYEIEYKVDPSILGGIIIYDGDRVYDGSVASQLDMIKQTLL